jgi:hypothetical protein
MVVRHVRRRREDILDDSPDLAWLFIKGPAKMAEPALIDTFTKDEDLATKEFLTPPEVHEGRGGRRKPLTAGASTGREGGSHLAGGAALRGPLYGWDEERNLQTGRPPPEAP